MKRLLPVLAGALVLATAASAATHPGREVRNARYCEVIEVHSVPPGAVATVWNTIGLNACPETKWKALDARTLARARGDTFVLLNGPRYFLMDRASGVVGARHTFGGLAMRRVASIRIPHLTAITPYTDRTIGRTNTWVWNRGRTVFELIAPGGRVYVMQSYAQIVDSSLSLADLPSLGHRLHLPPGWRYATRRLRRPLVLDAAGSATVTQDDLEDTYQFVPRALVPR